MTAIEYCYRPSANAGSGHSTFSWTVLILEDTGNHFVINKTYIIQDHAGSREENCTMRNGQAICCDRTNISRFNLPMNFVFGVTESPPGNTHNAKLLRFADAFLDSLVDTRLVSRADQSLSIGSIITYTNQPLPRRGLLLLWFVIGKLSHKLSNLILLNTTHTDFNHANNLRTSVEIFCRYPNK